MGRQWNNGDLSQLRTPLMREQIEERISIEVAPEPLFQWLRTTTPAEWFTGETNAQPSLPTGGLWKHATWTDPSFAALLFGRNELAFRWYSTRVDATSRRLELYFALGEKPEIVGTLMIGVTSQSDAQIDRRSDLQCELTCLSLSAQGNEFFDVELRERMKTLPALIGKNSLQAVDPDLRDFADAVQARTPVDRSVRASHSVVIQEQDMAIGPQEGFLLACPVAELKWIERWSFDLLHSTSGLNERHCVFSEAQSSLFVLARKGRTTWTTVEFDRQRRRFTAVLVTAGAQIGLFEFSVEELGDGRARLRWDLTFSPTSLKGESLLAEPHTQKHLGEMLVALQTAVVHYLRTRTLYTSPVHTKVHLVGSRLATRVHRHFAPHL